MATVGQRIKAAQAQAGGITRREIAEKPGRPAKFGFQTIGRVIQGKRALEPHEADWLAGVLGVDPDFFFDDPPAAEEPLERIARIVTEQLAEHARRVEEHLERQSMMLDRIERALDLDQTARAGMDDSAKRLLAAAADASRAFRDASRGTASNPGPQAT